jgi:adenosine kinase
MHIYISGSLAYDRIMDFPDKFANHLLPDKLHILNVCFLVNDLEEKFGGTAGNIAYSLALLEESPVVLAAAGSDFGRYRSWMQQHSISLRGIMVMEEVPTASAYITTDMADNQITAFNPGAMKYPTHDGFRDFETAGSLGIVSPGNLEDMQAYPRIYKELGIPYIFDPGQNIPAFSGDQLTEMLTGCSVLMANDYELSMIMQATGLDEPGLLRLCDSIVVTLGEQGATVMDGESRQDVPAVRIDRPQDPTGAGDAFRAGFIKGLAMSRDKAEAAKMGSVCASFCVERKGTQEHAFSMGDFWQRYRETHG